MTTDAPQPPKPSAASGLPWRAILALVAIAAAATLGFALTRDDLGAAEPVAARAAPATPTSTAAAAIPSTPAGPGGKVEAKDTTFDAGAVDRGAKITHSFELRNVGEHDLTVDAKPGCGCTVAEFDKVIPPGGTGKVTATVDTTNFKGPITKSVTVTTNDPAMQRLSLSMKADVKVALDIQPSEMATFQGRLKEMKPAELTITATDGSKFDILSATPNPVADVGVAFSAAPGQSASKKPGTLASGASSYVMTVSPSPDWKVGQANSGAIELKTTHPKAQDLSVRYFANVTGNVAVEPQRVMLSPPPVPTAEGVSQNVRITGAQGTKLVVKNPTSFDPRITATLAPAGEAYDLTLTYKGEPVAASVSGNVTLETNDALQPTLTIPVYVRPAIGPGMAMPLQGGAGIAPAAAPGHEGHGH